jgi:hypothetical protein
MPNLRPEKKTRRMHKKTITFNEMEMKAVGQYMEKYRVKNQSKFFREAIIATILQKAEEDHPKLF